jgi:threonine dehydrogenase-like Zn-dependent dehydrogenase
MRAIAITVGAKGARVVERPEPAIEAKDQVKLRVVRVGICGTDREQAAGGRALAPEGSQELVIGHEMLGQVVETGSGVTRVKAGDYAVFTVRRGCSKCMPCTIGRPDMCRTGEYRERGIWGLDGYQAEFVADSERWLVEVPHELADVAVLAEPMSVVEKAIYEAVAVQAGRLPDAQATPQWLHGRRCLVTGLGPIGLLAATILRLRGAEVWGLDVVDEASVRAQWLEAIAGRYVDGRSVDSLCVQQKLGAMDFIVEATGVPKLSFNLLEALAPDGAIVLTGIPGGERPAEIPGSELVRDIVLKNLLMVGSVNAARDHFQMGVDDLALARLRWGGQLAKLITHRVSVGDAPGALTEHTSDEIKAVIEWS